MIGMRTPHREPAVPALTTEQRETLCSRCFSHAAGTPSAWGCPGSRQAPMLGERLYLVFVLLLMGGMVTGLVRDVGRSVADHEDDTVFADVAAIVTCAAEVAQQLAAQQADAGAKDAR